MIQTQSRFVIAFVAALIWSAVHGQAHSAEIRLEGLLGSKAVLMIDGQRRIVAQGSSSPEGVKLLAIEQETVVLEVNGQREEYTLGSGAVSTSFSRPSKVTEQIYKDLTGMYRTIGSINGYPVGFLVDTGATAVAMSSNEAKRLGINYQLKGRAIYVNTASGQAKAFRVLLDSVGVGSIKLNNVDAVVIDGPHPREVLLGMSFLGRVKLQNQGEIMVLETRN